MNDIVILSGVRTAIGGFGGALSGLAPHALGVIAARAAIERAGIEPARIGTTIFGHVINTEPKDMYLSRLAAMGAGVPDTTPALNVNRLCGSGVQAVISATLALRHGEADFALAGGAECMSRAPYAVQAARFGQKMGDAAMVDMLVGTLSCPFGTGHMGITAENVAAEHGVSRADQDAFALESQQRAARASAAGHFRDQIVPVELQSRRGVELFDRDEHPKETSLAALEQLKPVFRQDGSVTAGNASGINDGAAALVLARADAAERLGLTPIARILDHAIAGVRPEVMGIGPVPAVRQLLERTGLKAADFDVIESNEAFAAQAVAVTRALDLDPARVNPNGGAIALGHPVGATGSILLVKAINELKRIGGRRGLVTMCIGGGQGIALAIEMN
ncbi:MULTISPECIES: beta-ketothiolase BktB [Paracoccus]|uniref:beta-ketothiolase BktB n=1 Tax=Paracoccus TaxID=265 RepID=UPI001FB815CB|nr:MULTISPECIES: beta-ketothiolase BktB [Paracoccus]MCJ1901050.1 beta-ketothiolase BktB [Paracoccus versutus]MDF3904276.1 beta-ketothiolase BktB [Paracoccus sp. AS002]